MPIEGLKPKDLIGIPWRVAFALQADGWWLRSDIIWHKPAPMPESVRDRPTRSHEYIFLLTKSERYHYNHEAIKEPSVCNHPSGNGYKRDGKTEEMSTTGQNAFRAVTETRNRRDVWTLGSSPTPEAHFATFPIELPEICIKAGTREGDTVLDPFSGAGTTGLACLKNGRRYIGIELNESYIAIGEARVRRHYPLLFGSIGPTREGCFTP